MISFISFPKDEYLLQLLMNIYRHITKLAPPSPPPPPPPPPPPTTTTTNDNDDIANNKETRSSLSLVATVHTARLMKKQVEPRTPGNNTKHQILNG